MLPDWFTPASARAVIDRVRPAAERARTIFRAMESCPADHAAPDRLVEPAYFDLVIRLHESIGRLTRIGVVVRDLRRGRIDFPARREGRPVLICWEVGESAPGFWRELHDDPAERRPLDDPGPWDEPAREGRPQRRRRSEVV